ncbi:MAG: hypothetical protein IT209_08465 [Armatimonadetes bacterium]|nr:hypothetical protein [Armatimonadota bacterium]
MALTQVELRTIDLTCLTVVAGFRRPPVTGNQNVASQICCPHNMPALSAGHVEQTCRSPFHAWTLTNTVLVRRTAACTTVLFNPDGTLSASTPHPTNRE